MKRKYLLLILIIILPIILFLVFRNVKNEDSYVLKDDRIKSVTILLGDRNLIKKTKHKYKDTIIKTYKYTKIKDPYTDLSKYIIFLEGEANFIPTKDYNLNNKKGSIQLSRYSTNKEYIIIMDITYNKHSYTIKITRGKGKITPLNNS